MGLTGLAAKAFLFGCNRTEAQGLEKFVRLLDERKNIEGRKRGLLTGPFGIDNVIFLKPNLLALPAQFPIMSACTCVLLSPQVSLIFPKC